jgi:hypothetical protein
MRSVGFCGGEEDGVRDKPRDAAIGGSSPGNPGPLDTPFFCEMLKFRCTEIKVSSNSSL